MSLLNLKNLKTKTEPQNNNNKWNTVKDKSLSNDIIEIIKEIKPSSTLIIGEGATINGTIKENNEISIQGKVEGTLNVKI